MKKILVPTLVFIGGYIIGAYTGVKKLTPILFRMYFNKSKEGQADLDKMAKKK